MSDSSLRSRRRESPELNVTSLIDVVLLLLMFFMLSTTFNRPSEIKVDLPEAKGDGAAQSSAPASIEVSIDRDGHYFVDQKPVPTDKLGQILLQAAQSTGPQDVTVQLFADAQTTHQAVITAMDAAQQVGILRFAFRTIEEH